MVMAMTSRAEPGEDPPSLGASVAASPTPTPVPVASGEGVPTELPMIALDSELPASPSGGLVTKKPDASLKITVPETVIRTRELKLEILHDGEVVDTILKPSGIETPEPIHLAEGPNRLSARLVGPKGPGPMATEIVVILDTQSPTLKVNSPRDHQPVDGERVTVRGESDPGASCRHHQPQDRCRERH